MKAFGPAALDELRAAALATPRGRINLNWHDPQADGIQRFFNLMLPGTYVRPHRHSLQGRWELTLLLEGAVDLLCFDDTGIVTRREALATQALRAVEVPSDCWHSYVVTGAEALLFEIKQGPYDATQDKLFAPWAPAEGSPQAAQLGRWLTTAQPGQRYDATTS